MSAASAVSASAVSASAVSEESPGPVLAIVGPTAAGKSGLAVALAERLGAEIVNVAGTEPVTVQDYCNIAGELLG